MERILPMFVVAGAVGYASTVVNYAVAKGLNRFTNLTPSIPGALAAGGVSGLSALGYVAIHSCGKAVIDKRKITDVDTKRYYFFLTGVRFNLALPIIGNAILTPNLSRVFPKCSVTWYGGIGYGALNGLVSLVTMFVVFCFGSNELLGLACGFSHKDD